MNEQALFYYRSFCDKALTGFDLTGSTDYLSTTLNYAIDRDRSTAARTSGKNDDATNADFIVDFLFNRSIDTVAIRSNFKTFTVYYSTNGSSWTQFADHAADTTGFTLDTLVSPVTARYIKVSCTATITADSEKRLTEIVVTRSICGLPISEIEAPEQGFQRITAKNLKGGSIQLVPFPQFPKLHVVLGFKNLTARYADYESLKSQFLIDACLIYLYYSDEITQLGPDALYLVNDVADKKFPLSANVIIAGANGSLELEEV